MRLIHARRRAHPDFHRLAVKGYLALFAATAEERVVEEAATAVAPEHVERVELGWAEVEFTGLDRCHRKGKAIHAVNVALDGFRRQVVGVVLALREALHLEAR